MNQFEHIVVDVESDGPCPGLYSMVSFGAAFNGVNGPETFYSGVIKPLDGALWMPDALAVSGISREEQCAGRHYGDAISEFNDWLLSFKITNPIFWSDNLAFDWQFINYYFHLHLGKNPFGFSGRRIGDYYAGAVKDRRAASKWKKYRVTKHTHKPDDDALGNLEALNTIESKYIKEK